MENKILQILVCPKCRNSLKLINFQTDANLGTQNEIKEGILLCNCGNWYPIINYIPRMLIGSLRDDYSAFIQNFKSLLSDKLIFGNQKLNDSTSKNVRRTKESFGFEWAEFSRFGWEGNEIEDEEGQVLDYKSHAQEKLMSHTLSTFERKSMFNKNDLNGKLVLDAGCGNGRYSYAAYKYGAKVIAIDLSKSVEAAFENTKGINNISVVQADLFNLPFRENTFDVIFSIGVLHHTPSAKKSFLSLVKTLKSGGSTSIHLYHKGNILWELNDSLIRKITTKLPLRVLWNLIYILTFIGWLSYKNKLLYAFVNAFLRAHPVHHHNFDWYSAPIATHHTTKEVINWFNETGLSKISDDNPTKSSDSYYNRLYPKILLKKDGTVRNFINIIYPQWSLTVKGKKINHNIH